MNNFLKLSVIIPVFNEEKNIKAVFSELSAELKKLNLEYEIIAINDGSNDQSGQQLKEISGIRLISHPYNKGYGASLKTGAKHAQHDWLLFFDADGQHKTEHIKEFIKYAGDYDLVMGCRQGYKGPLVRQPGKKVIHWIANYLTETKIPDINCGFRLIKKEYFQRYRHLFPNNFSLSTTSTIAFLKDGLTTKYLPITINRREGKSSVKIYDGFRTILLAIRLIMLFSPLKIFLPIALAGFVLSLFMVIRDLAVSNFYNVSKSAGFVFIASLLVFLFGLLADQIAAVRREIKRD